MSGSCFAENIGNKLRSHKFNICLNPFGIIYHPQVLAQNIRRVMSGKPYNEKELEFHNGLWCSFDHHGRFSHTDAGIALEQMNSKLQYACRQLAGADMFFVTFGTAWAYRLKNNGRVVANCHKYPASDFERFRSTDAEICDTWYGLISELRQFNPKLKIIFTVSPVRHLREDAHENQLSKSILLLAVDKLIEKTENTGYFPAYEIMMDELRDYRFYDRDMVHPNDVAVDYLWQRFCDCYISDRARQVMKEVEDILRASAHRQIHDTPGRILFATNFLDKISRLRERCPELDFSKETELFEKYSGTKNF
jgi:hypothetical protein